MNYVSILLCVLMIVLSLAIILSLAITFRRIISSAKSEPSEIDVKPLFEKSFTPIWVSISVIAVAFIVIWLFNDFTSEEIQSVQMFAFGIMIIGLFLFATYYYLLRKLP